MINSRSIGFSKNRGKIISEYKTANGIRDDKILTAREQEILQDLCNGFSRSSISMNRGISITRVKQIINSIYAKLGVDNVVEAVRVATEKKLI
jgi:DNA-binding NarL/FixJ family response regulator